MTIKAIVNNYLMKGDSGLRSEKAPYAIAGRRKMRYLNIGRVGGRVRKERRRVSRHVPSDRRQQEPQMM
jgi:hypothetical protein